MNQVRIWAVLLAGSVATANAHSHLLSSIPAQGSTLTAAPTQVVLGFSESSHLAALSVARGMDAPIKIKGLPKLAARQLTVGLPKLAAGAWTLAWRVIADDGHITHGTVHFSIVSAP